MAPVHNNSLPLKLWSKSVVKFIVRIRSSYIFKDILCFTLVVNIVLCTQLNVTKSCITSATTLYKTYESYNKPCDTCIMINKAWASGISSFKWLNICSERVTRLYFIFFMSPLFIVILTLYPLYALTTGFVLNRDNNYILVLKSFCAFLPDSDCSNLTCAISILNLQCLSELHPCHENMIGR